MRVMWDQGVVAAAILVTWWVLFWIVILFGYRETPEMAISERDKVIRDVSQMVESVYGGSWRKAFDTHDKNEDGFISGKELNDVLRYSGVGNFLTRGTFVNECMKAIDKDDNALISWAEFMAVFQPTTNKSEA